MKPAVIALLLVCAIGGWWWQRAFRADRETGPGVGQTSPIAERIDADTTAAEMPASSFSSNSAAGENSAGPFGSGYRSGLLAGQPIEGEDSAPALNSAPADTLPERAASAAPAEAEIVKEEGEAGILFQAEPAEPDETELALRFKKMIDEEPNTASWNLLKAFQSEKDPVNRAYILCTATQLNSDQNTRLLLQFALSSAQPPEVRSAAMAYAAEQEPDLLLTQLGRLDLELKQQLDSILDEPVMPDESRVIGGHPRPAVTNLAPVPADANPQKQR